MTALHGVKKPTKIKCICVNQKESEWSDIMLKRVFTLFLCLQKLVKICLQGIYKWFLPIKYKSINDDIILITGGGRGIGQKLAIKFVKHHPKHIILCGRSEPTLSDTARAVQEQGVNCAYMICDVSSREQVYSMAQEVQAKFGQVTILVNNAGVVYGDTVLEAKAEEIISQVKTNTIAHFWTIKAFLPSMLENNHGHLVSMNSMLGWAGLNGAAFYSASKFACSAFIDALREELIELDKSNVHITSVYPYHVDNDMFAGVTTRFPRLFPPVNEDHLATKIVDAVLTNRSKVIVPKLMYLVAWFYSIAPVGAVTAIMKFIQVHKAMQHCKDTQKSNSKSSHS